jgi:hypothetical protein
VRYVGRCASSRLLIPTFAAPVLLPIVILIERRNIVAERTFSDLAAKRRGYEDANPLRELNYCRGR